MDSPQQNQIHDEDVRTTIHDIQAPGNTTADTIKVYNARADQYEQHILSLGYKAPKIAADYLAQQKLPKDARILDIAAGTGLCAEALINDHGYTNVEALDAAQDMLDISDAKKIYRQLHCLLIGDGNKLPFADNTYDAAVIAGSFAQGHIKCDCFEELIRIIKPGGYIVNTIRDEVRTTVPEYRKLDAVIQSHEDNGHWDTILEEITPRYYLNKDARTWVHRIK